MTMHKKLDKIIATTLRIEAKTDLVGKLTADTFNLLGQIKPVQALPQPSVEAPPVIRAKVRQARKAKAQAKPSQPASSVVTTTKAKRDRWYALGEGSVRDVVGMSSKPVEGGKVRCTFTAKKGASPTKAQIAQAVAVVK